MITAVNGEAVADSHDLARKIAALGPKKDAELTFVRNGATADGQGATRLAVGRPSGQRRHAGAGRQGRAGEVGMTLEPATAVEGAGKTGVVVADVDPDGAAAQKGLQTGDVILAVAGKAVSRPSEVAAAIDSAKSDGKKSVLMQVKNEDGTHFIALSTQAVS